MANDNKKFEITPLHESKEINRVLANNTCRIILNALSNEPLSSSQISEKLQIPLSTVDDNIKKLAKVGLVNVHHARWSPKGRKVNFYQPQEKFIILTPRFEREKVLQTLRIMLLPVIVLVALIGAGLYLGAPDKIVTTEGNFLKETTGTEFAAAPATGENALKKFSTYDELKGFVGKRTENYKYMTGGDMGGLTGSTSRQTALFETTSSAGPQFGGFGASAAAKDYSKTNVQVEGVDEADIVKTDGKYIYVISGSKLLIVDAYPPENAKVVSEVALKETPLEIFVNGDKLVLFEQQQYRAYDAPIEGETDSGDIVVEHINYETPATNAIVFDIADRKAPRIIGSLTVSGAYFDSRMIGDYVYFVAQQPIDYYSREVPLPLIMGGDETRVIQAPEIYYFDTPDSSYSYSNIISINLKSGQTESEVVLTGTSQSMYVSEKSIYMAHTKWLGWNYYDEAIKKGESPATEKTVVHRISTNNGEIKYRSSGEVPGTVLNQFSMDEYENYFRIATTSNVIGGEIAGGLQNNVYVLDSNLNIVGKLEGLAEGEKIYSVRFMGKKVHLVTFRQIDPLFVIDLSNPRAPKVLGYLKIPGFSDYLHPYDDNHLIGIGKDATEMGQVKGMKLSLFDVSNVAEPKEISRYYIGGPGTDSEALKEHKAFLFSREKNLLAIPVSINDGNRNLVWQGAYVFKLDLEKGFVFKGGVSHRPELGKVERLNYEPSVAVRRSLYMENILYTISDKMIKMNELEKLGEINKVQLYYLKENIYS